MKKALLLASVVVALSVSAFAAEKLEEIVLAPEEAEAIEDIGEVMAEVEGEIKTDAEEAESEIKAESEEVETVVAEVPAKDAEPENDVELIPALGPNTSYAKKVYDARLPKLECDFTAVATNSKGRFNAGVIVNGDEGNAFFADIFKSKGEYVNGLTLAYDSDAVLDGKYALIGVRVAPMNGESFEATSAYTILESGRQVRLPVVMCKSGEDSMLFISVSDSLLTTTDEGYKALPVALVKNSNKMRETTFGNVDSGFDNMLSSGIITY